MTHTEEANTSSSGGVSPVDSHPREQRAVQERQSCRRANETVKANGLGQDATSPTNPRRRNIVHIDPDGTKLDGGVPPAFLRQPGLHFPMIELFDDRFEIIEAGGPAVAGGDGNVTAENDGGGKVLQDARVVLIYWGAAWADAATTPSADDFTDAIRKIVNGPWGAKLTQYRGASVGYVEAIDINSGSDPKKSFTDDQIWTMIDGRISNNKVPTPAKDIDRIYCVVMPTGHSSGDTSFVGQHQYRDRAGVRVYWAWVTNDGSLTGGNSVPKIFTHEVAEACSDPDIGTGITLTSVNGDEIGDVCNNTYSVVDGHAEEAYWSVADNRCVLPQTVLRIAGGPSAADAADGRIEIFVRGTDNHVWHLYQTTPNGDWSDWEDLSTYRPLPAGTLSAVGDPTAGHAADGRIEIFVRGTDNHVWHLYQTTPNGDWSEWEDLSNFRPTGF
jgi:acylphosphatase